MRRSTKLAMAGTLAATLFAGVAVAEEYTRTGPNGSVSRVYDAETGLSVNRSGVNGGSISGTVTCARGPRLCERTYSATNPDGETVTGARTSQHGRYRTRATNTVTKADGTTTTYNTARPRYTGVRAAPRVKPRVRW